MNKQVEVEELSCQRGREGISVAAPTNVPTKTEKTTIFCYHTDR